ncbi:MAG: hypothetical protein IPK27_10760 [Rhodanobacteraceae bacterium]|nr:hypothetical protein [Rhodanobacteraceae bacterium]
MTTELPFPDAPRLQADDLPLRVATAEEIAAVRGRLKHTQMVYNLEQAERVLIHDGDLTVRGHFDNGDIVVVRGSLRVQGMYDDYVGGPGVLVVEGDMDAAQVYSWGALWVGGRLRVPGVLMAVYNDYTFEVRGPVDTRLLLISDKSSDYPAGDIALALTDDASDGQRALALRHLLPEAYTAPEHLDAAADAELWELRVDEGWLRARMRSGEPVFREQPGPEGLAGKALRALATEVTQAEQLELLQEDPLLAQLIASVPGRPAAVMAALAQLGDGQVDRWLGRHAPERMAARDPLTLSPALQRSLAENPQTPEAMVAALAAAQDAEVRLRVASREQLADAVLERLQDDPDPGVRERLWRLHGWETGFGWEPGAEAIDARLRDAVAEVREAMVYTPLDTAQIETLWPQLSTDGQRTLADQILDQALGAAPGKLTVSQHDALAMRWLAIEVKGGGARAQAMAGIRTAAWLSLDPRAHATRLAAELDAALDDIAARRPPRLDLLRIAQHTRSAPVLQLLAGRLTVPQMEPLAESLAKNPLLPVNLQRLLVRRAADWIRAERQAASRASAREIAERIVQMRESPAGTLDTLLQNDALAAAAIEDTLALILEIGIRPDDGSFQNSFFHLRILPPTVIAQLDQRLGFSSDWALTLMLQAHANRAQLTRALARWYDDDAQLQADLAATAGLPEGEFWLALAKSSSPRLREAALHPHSTAQAVQWLIDHPDPALGHQAQFHPASPLAGKLAILATLGAGDWDTDAISLPADTWAALARSAPQRAQRRVALMRAARAAARLHDSE